MDGEEQFDGSALIDHLEVIESQPLEVRAVQYSRLADELTAQLQRSDPQGDLRPSN